MAEFLIDGQKYEIQAPGQFLFGPEEVLSRFDTDPTFGQDWYELGYNVTSLLENEFESLLEGVTKCVCEIGGKNFALSKYHENVSEELHRSIVTKTRDLYPSDFNFNVPKLIDKLGSLFGFKLTDIDPDTGNKLHIIVRINRPKSDDYNPPHKDIYQQYDETGIVPKCINFWVPICGVTSKSTLPLVPFSHMLSESKVLRTTNGGMIGNKKYRVRSILSWDGKNELFRPSVAYGQVLTFSSHLIHGLAINEQEEETRVALEFRLFKA